MMKNLIRPLLFIAALVPAFLLSAYFVQAKEPSAPDPIWCPVGVNPISRVGGCSPSFRTFTELLAWLHANDPSRPGVIWLERTYNSAVETADGFTLDGRDFTNFDTQPLTIQGGWNGTGLTTINHTDPSVFSGDSLYFHYWNSAVTVNDVDFDHTTESGLSIHTTGDLHLSNVHVQYSIGPTGSGHGAVLSNFEGTGNVTVSDSSFNHNRGTGLLVSSAGAVTLTNITANGNGFSDGGYHGVSVSNRSGTSGVTIAGENVFNDNDAGGLSVFSRGPIVVHNITANGHLRAMLGKGVYLTNIDALTPQPITLLGSTHIFNNNALTGLGVSTNGTIYAENLTAIGNGLFGAFLENSRGSADLTLAGNNAFLNNHGYYGFSALSGGTVSLSMITAAGNHGDGARINTPGDASVNCAKVYGNGNYGIEAGMKGAGVGGSLELNDVVFDHLNVSGDYNYAGTASITSGGCSTAGDKDPVPPIIPMHILEGLFAKLDCYEYGGTLLILPDGTKITLPCPTLGDLIVKPTFIDVLPDPLPGEVKFISGLDLSLTTKSEKEKITPGTVSLSFAIPKEIKNEKLSILFWDGKTWVDLKDAQFGDGRKVFEGGSITSEDTFEAQFNFMGIFILVSR